MAVAQRYRGKQKYCVIHRLEGVTNPSKVKRYAMTPSEVDAYLSKYRHKII